MLRCLRSIHAQKKKSNREHSRWQIVEDLAKKFPKIPVILNGDIKDKKSYDDAIKASPSASGIMIARAAAQKPWIFAELSLLLTDARIDCEQLALDFINDVEECQPEEFWKTRLQRFFAYYCLNFSFAHYFQTQMLNAKDNDDARARVRAYFEKCPDDKILFPKS